MLTSSAVVVVYASQNSKLNETAFLYSDGKNHHRLEIYASGKLVHKLTVNDRVCTANRCASKEQFNRYELSEYYPDELISDILGFVEIKNLAGSTIEPDQEGFVQTAKTANYDIVYKKTANSVSFRDTKNRIIISIKRI